MYKYYNANPFQNKVPDCFARAISYIENKPYEQTFRELSEYALNRGLTMDSVESIEGYLDDHYERICFNNITVGEFAETHPNGRYLATMNGHITAIDYGGIIIDTFDPSKRILKCVWRVN